MTRLWHYTCEHSVAAIAADRGTLRPNPKAGRQEFVDAWVYPVVWLTDVDVQSHVDACVIGLGNRVTDCDRTGWRYIVPRVGVVPWAAWADAHADPGHRYLLELAPGADAARWWVCPGPIAGARLDERYRPLVLGR